MQPSQLTYKFVPFLFVIIFLLVTSSFALEPEEVLVIANKKVAGSISLAKYYMQRRGIPQKNLLTLRISDEHWCSREEYEDEVVPAIRGYIENKNLAGDIKCLVTIYGMPLRIRPAVMTRNEKDQLAELKIKQATIRKALKTVAEDQPGKKEILRNELRALGKQGGIISKNDHRAAFDSELSLVLVEDYPVDGWVLNPYYLGLRGKNTGISKDKVLMVSRLDGPDEETVKRIIDDSIMAEKNGLQGRAYFDAKSPRLNDNKNMKSAYSQYDKSLHLAADRVKKSNRMPVTVNDKVQLFQAGDCPDAALYCGWYSRAKYIDAFEWKPGAVGYHIASSECTTLKDEKSQVWCKMMLEDGVAATLGPVSEPYLQAFPPPEMFFGLLVDGYYSLAESYILSLPYLSWQMVLVGDPLYRPFKNKVKEP